MGTDLEASILTDILESFSWMAYRLEMGLSNEVRTFEYLRERERKGQ